MSYGTQWVTNRDLRCLEAILVGHDRHDLFEWFPFLKIQFTNCVLEGFPCLSRDLFS